MADAEADADLQRPVESLPEEMWDVIIVGAGPAGSAAAIHLASNGHRALVLEKAPMPRVKPCGGAVSVVAASHLPFRIPDTLVNGRCYGVRVHYAGKSAEARQPDPLATMVSRSAFDHFLVRQAEAKGARLRWEAARGLAVEGDAAGFVDPFSGEGIAYAIRSGQLAAQTAAEALKADDFSQRRLSTYVDRCRAEFDRGLRDALLIAKLVHRCPSVLLRILSSDLKILVRYLTVPQGRMSYRGFGAWLLARLPLLAARGRLFARPA